jgi:hypothetical protein
MREENLVEKTRENEKSDRYGAKKAGMSMDFVVVM